MTTTATTLKGQPLDRDALDGVLRRRMFYTPSFEVRRFILLAVKELRVLER